MRAQYETFDPERYMTEPEGLQSALDVDGLAVVNLGDVNSMPDAMAELGERLGRIILQDDPWTRAHETLLEGKVTRIRTRSDAPPTSEGLFGLRSRVCT
ncbi:MAG: hypothetical protein ACRD4B_07525 [Acidobacteriota bacterium]